MKNVLQRPLRNHVSHETPNKTQTCPKTSPMNSVFTVNLLDYFTTLVHRTGKKMVLAGLWHGSL